MSDERLRNLSDKARMPRGAAIDAEDRSRDEPREVSDDQRIEAFRARQFQFVLPDLPEIPGYKCIWLSTENLNDMRQREADGYVPVTPNDVPGWAFPGMSDGGQAGTINIREMRAYKLPVHLWNAYMSINHHEKPMEDDSKLIARIDSRVGAGKSLVADGGEASGIAEIREGLRVKSPWK